MSDLALNLKVSIAIVVQILNSEIRNLDPVHRVEKIFSLRIDTDAKFFTFAPQPLLQFGRTLPGARAVGDDNHSKLPLHHRLVDINNAAAGFR